MLAQDADHILIPLLNGDYTLAQIAEADDDAALVLITHRRMTLSSEVFPLNPKDIKAAAYVALGGLEHDHWPIIGYEPIPTLPRGAVQRGEDRTVHAPEIIEAFANALHGLYPWDGFPDVDFFTNMLVTPDLRPPKARMSADFPKADTE